MLQVFYAPELTSITPVSFHNNQNN